MKRRIFTLNEPNAPRINPALAKEIGLNESLILLQIEFWISISNNERDGKRWTYQSVRDMQEKSFSFWSISTINRAVNKLIDEGYIIEGNFNKMKYDKTRWFALNFETLNELESISINGDDTGVFHNDTRSNQNDTRSNQNDTTIPEITTEITTEKDHSTAKAEPPIPYKKIIGYLNEKADRKFSHVAKSNKDLIKARWNGLKKLDSKANDNELYQAFVTVIDNKVADAKDPNHFFKEEYLQPSTLFRESNFDKYLNQPSRQKQRENRAPKTNWDELESLVYGEGD